MTDGAEQATGAGVAPAPLARLAAVAAGLSLIACSTSSPAPPYPSQATERTMVVYLFDFRFEPDRLEVTVGERVRLVLVNRSDLPHELYVGSAADQDTHHTLHAAAPPDAQAELESDGSGVYVPPNGSAQLSIQFATVGQLMMGCHLVGHFEAGMVGTIDVQPRS